MQILAEPLTAEAFKPFGAVLEGTLAPGRYYVSDTLASSRDHAPISLAVATVAPTGARPLEVKVLERHAHSSQTFIPLHVSRYLVLATVKQARHGWQVVDTTASDASGVELRLGDVQPVTLRCAARVPEVLSLTVYDEKKHPILGWRMLSSLPLSIELPANVVQVPNTAGLLGGIALWRH